MALPLKTRTCLYNSHQLERVLTDMASQVSAILAGREKITLVGILRRGAPLSGRLAEKIVELHGFPPLRRFDLSIKRYADDLSLLYPETQLREDDILSAQDLTDHALLVVDDVLYTGHSLIRAVEYLNRKNPAEIRVATLVDRGVVSLPVHADVVGLHLDVAPSDIIEIHIPPFEPDFRIELIQPGRKSSPAVASR